MSLPTLQAKYGGMELVDVKGKSPEKLIFDDLFLL